MKPPILYNEKYGKPALIGMSICLWVVLGILFTTYGYEATWRLWGIPTRMPPFVDFRLIPASAESFRMGFEPSISNPRDPEQHIFNYPAFWRIFFYSNITQADTVWIVILMLVLFFGGAFLFPTRLTIPQAAWMLAILFSPACMLLYERGNVDLIVFFLCTMIVIASSYSGYGTALLIATGTIVKFFPFFGIAVLLKEEPRKFWWLVAGCIIVLVGYMIAAAASVTGSWTLTMRGFEISYGANTLFRRYELPLLHWLGQHLPLAWSGSLLRFGPIVMGLVVFLTVAFRAIQDPRNLEAGEARNLAAFRMGAAVYVGTFMLGNNWDYRLAFLALVIPQLVIWMRFDEGKIRSVAQFSILCIVLSCWHLVIWDSPMIRTNFVWRESAFVLDELINWIAMATLAYLLAASGPEWLKFQLRSFVPARARTHTA